jgi:hypothetical protein
LTPFIKDTMVFSWLRFLQRYFCNNCLR